MRKVLFALIFMMAFLCSLKIVSVAFAQGNETTTPTEPGTFEPIYDVFKSIGYAAPVAVIMGIITCMLGYMKQTTPQNFKLEEFIATTLISLVIGIATIYGGWTYTDIAQWIGNGGLTIWIYWAAKIIAKKLQPATTAVTATVGSLTTA